MKKKLKRLYDAIFDVAFADKLNNQPKLVVWPMGQDYGYYMDGIIELVTSQHLQAENFWGEVTDTLAHELTHAYQDQLGVLHETNEKKMHDKFFKREFKTAMKRLNEEWNEAYN